MLKHRRQGRLYYVVATAAIGVATLATTPLARADDIELNVEAPQQCPSTISPSGYFQGNWFWSVRMMKRSGTGNVGNFENIDAAVTSSNGKWLWESGGGTFTCSRVYLVLGLYVDYQTLVPPSYGVMVPAGDDDTSDDGSVDDGSYDEDGSWYADSGGTGDDCEDVDVYDEDGNYLGSGNTCDLFAE
jgi:hypothetical protein